VTFLIGAGGVVRGSISKAPDPRQPDELDVFKVICKGGRVTVIGRDQARTTRVFATARWRGGELDRRTLSNGVPRLTADEWTMIRNAFAEHVDGTRPEALRPERPEAAREVVSRSPLKLDQPSATFKAVVWGSMAAIMALTAVLSYTCTRKDEPATAVAAPAPAPVTPATPPLPLAPEEPIEVRITKADSLKDAFALAKPTMTDSAEAFSPGAQLLATYAVGKLRWEDVDVAAETTFGHVLKDADVERGKRMCGEGELVAIQRRDLGPRKIYVGSLRVSEKDTIAFVAVGTTGDLIRGSKARFCGAVTGIAGPTVSMLGMFDLPENRTPIVEQ